MKRRVIKKWINRYITPMIKDLPKTQYGQHVIDVGNGMELLIGKSHVFGDGYLTPEGCYIQADNNKLSAIKRTANMIREIRNNYDHVYLRVKPEIWNNHIYIRLVTEVKA